MVSLKFYDLFRHWLTYSGADCIWNFSKAIGYIKVKITKLSTLFGLKLKHDHEIGEIIFKIKLTFKNLSLKLEIRFKLKCKCYKLRWAISNIQDRAPHGSIAPQCTNMYLRTIALLSMIGDYKLLSNWHIQVKNIETKYIYIV